MPQSADPNRAAINAVRAVLAEPVPEPAEYIEFQVRRCVLLVGPSESVFEMARSLRNNFDVVAVIYGPRPESRLLGVSVICASRVELSGYLGQFHATACDTNGQSIDLSAKSGNDDGCFDLVLDLSPTPLLDRSVPPLGYLRPGDRDQYESVLGDIPKLCGKFRKPRYFNFESELCVHQRQQVAGCERCLQVCPAEAITSGVRTVTVDPHLCRGCGTCSMVCPSGALSYADPPRMLIIKHIESLLCAYRDAGGTRLWIGFHVTDDTALQEWVSSQDMTVLPYAVRSLASLGLESWLAAIGLGAEGIVLSIPENTPTMVVDTLMSDVEIAHKILEGIGYDRQCIMTLHGDDKNTNIMMPSSTVDMDSDTEWSYPVSDTDLRSRMLALLDRLSSRLHYHGDVNNRIELPTRASFGGVTINVDACTMCLACTSLCPTGALRADHDGAELAFMEATCIQCGLCEHGCPEAAVKRQPRFDYQRLSASNAVILNKTEMACCQNCGKPFMSAVLLATVLKRLAGDGAEILHAKQMLQVCPQCRADSALKQQFPAISGGSKP